MPTESTPIKDFFVGFGLLIGGSVVVLLRWLIPVGVLAALIYVGLYLLTAWGLIPKLVISGLASYITLSVLGLVWETFIFSPAWIDTMKKPTPCPHCGKNLRTALAKQCRHCGADWHSEI